MGSRPTIYLSPRELSARWSGKVSLSTLSRWRIIGNGPTFFRPSGKQNGRVLYPIGSIIRWEKRYRYYAPTQKEKEA